jgi:hypothetical protein
MDLCERRHGFQQQSSARSRTHRLKSTLACFLRYSPCTRCGRRYGAAGDGTGAGECTSGERKGPNVGGRSAPFFAGQEKTQKFAAQISGPATCVQSPRLRRAPYSRGLSFDGFRRALIKARCRMARKPVEGADAPQGAEQGGSVFPRGASTLTVPWRASETDAAGHLSLACVSKTPRASLKARLLHAHAHAGFDRSCRCPMKA